MVSRETADKELRAAVMTHVRRPGSRPRRIPTRPRPSVILTVVKPTAGGPPIPASGTVIAYEGITRLYIGRGWIPRSGETAKLAGELLGQLVVEITGTTVVATERARKLLRAAWRVGDSIASGLLPEDTAAAMQQALDHL